MAIVNRDGDSSEQKEVFVFASHPATGISYGFGVGTGVTMLLAGPMPYPYQLQSCAALATGASGSPQLVFFISRVIPGGGVTSIAVGISNMVIPNGASLMSVSTGYSGLAAQGSTLLLGLRGDIIAASTAVANTACTNLLINVVVKKSQDIVSHNGIAT